METFTTQITHFTQSFQISTAPASCLHILKLSLLDWCAVALAGVGEPVSRITRDMLNSEAGTPEAFIFGQATRLPARAAALANGTTSHALDYDDTHFLHIGHPSVAIFPAALALAERQNASGADFLTAALVGYEASCRIGHWLGRSHYEAGFHQTATAGAFGATLTAARLLKLPADQTRHALGLACTRVSGLKAQFGTMGKPFNAGMAASNGVEAAQLASHGFISNPEALETAFGFADTHAAAQTDRAEVLRRLGRDFVLEQVQHKFHACCHGLHAALEALQTLEISDLNDIISVTVHTHPRWLKVCNKPSPTTGLEAKFSYRQTVAMALAGVNTGALQSYSDAICQIPEIKALREKVQVVGDGSLADTASRVVLVLSGGDRREASFDLTKPMVASAREKRVREKAAALIGNEKSTALWMELDKLGQAASVQGLVGAL